MKGCTECWEQATHSHHEYNVMIYSCDKHKCDECNLIKDDNMTERRPHWDDELIFAVMSAAGDGGHLFIDDIHAVIAAVEDWEKETFNAATEVLVERIQKAEAQVQAVRELASVIDPIRGELHMAALHGWDTAMEMVLQLLESGEIKGFAFRIANLEGRVDE